MATDPTPPLPLSGDAMAAAEAAEDRALHVASDWWRAYALGASLATALLCVAGLLADPLQQVMRQRTALALLLLSVATAAHALPLPRLASRLTWLAPAAALLAWIGAAAPLLPPALRAWASGSLAETAAVPLSIAFCTSLLAGCLTLLHTARPGWAPRRVDDLCTVLACLAIALPYLTSLDLLYPGQGFDLPGVRGATLPASTGVLLLATAILALQPVRQAYAPSGPSSAGGRFFRAVLPMTLLLPAALGWLRQWGSRAGWYDSEAGMVGTVLASTTLLFCAALLSTRWIARFERALSARRISLEAGIQQRTAELRANQEQLTAIIGTVNTAIISIDASHRIVLFNAAAERIFGVPASQMLGQPLDPLLPERFRARHAQDVQVFDQAGSTTRPMDAGARLRGLRSNGEEFPIEAAISRVEVGGRRLMTVMLRDMSDTEALDAERRARLAAEEARRTQSRFLSHLSHELRTPLNAVIGFAQLLLVDPAAAERPSLHRYARHILQAGRQQLAMVTDLLELIRVEGAPAQPPDAVADAVQVVHDSVALMQALATQQGITLHWVAPASPAVAVQADAGGLGRALANLLSNAIKYNRPAGTVSVSVVEQATEVRIEVADTGPGLSESQLAHLFEPFNRLGREGGAIEGTGIGLTLSRRLAEQFGGRIEVHSVPDMGSTFTLVLRRPPPG